jgi:tripartite-type tricarboxylate transporter receptor subunit TctC
MFKLATGTNITDIPYKGGAQAIPDLLGGRIQMNIGTISTLAPLIRQGRLRALAVTSTERNAQLPDVPTMAESGLPGVTSVTYYSIFGPAHLPADVVHRVNTAVNASLKEPAVRAAIARIGFEPHPESPDGLANLLAKEKKIWEPIVRKTGFKLN